MDRKRIILGDFHATEGRDMGPRAALHGNLFHALLWGWEQDRRLLLFKEKKNDDAEKLKEIKIKIGGKKRKSQHTLVSGPDSV